MHNMSITGACDCHIHIVGPTEIFPQVNARPYTAGLATLESLKAAAGPLGVTRFVVVQPSWYGSDNACLFEALETLGSRGRGVAVIDPKNSTPILLQRYAERGVCGLRVNLYSIVNLPKAAQQLEALKFWISELPHGGWHVEVIAPLPVLARAALIIAESPVPIVIDHYGLPGAATTGSAEGRTLLELVGLPHVWVKLSGPYRILADPLATAPPAAWLEALLRVAPDRCVWGSDWPHTPTPEDQKAAGKPVPYRKLTYERVLGDFIAALPDPVIGDRILVTNPLRLYGFPPG